VADNKERTVGEVERHLAKSEQKLPRDCHGLDAIDPFTGKKWQIYLRDATMDRAVKIGPGALKELGFTLREEVQIPKAVFQGVREEGEPNWLCYVCRPDKAYNYRTGDRCRAWPGQVFIVVVDDDLIIRRALWVKADPNMPDLPENHDTRFDKRLL
jgi:hypothetical protein